MSSLILLGILVLICVAGYIFTAQFFAREGDVDRLEVLGVKDGRKETKSLLLRLSRPFLPHLMHVTQNLAMPEWRRKRQRQLLAAGMSDEITIEELLAYKAFMALVALILLAVFKPDTSWWVFVIVPLIGFFFPDQWLADRVKRRGKAISRALPDVVDMLALSVEAGLDFVAAMNKVVKKSRPGPLIDELAQSLAEMRVGSSRADALRNMAFRCNLRELNSFVSLLVQADKLGVSIGKVLRNQSERMRMERFQKAERLGAEASQKILFPLVLCIMPAVFIVFFGPLVIRFLTGGLF
ncbi:MAG: type II secretion system F family protein [Deltaproteobacteria bacterium]|nr:type II secretion system F family protein [Deltaproteobacteria bacterium]